MKTKINPAELVRIVHPGELKELRDEKASVYVPGWKTPKPAEIVSGWKLETICKFIEEGRLFYYPADPEYRQTVARIAPEDRELDKLPLAIMKLVDEDLKKIKEKGVEIVSHTWTPEPVIEVRTSKGIETIRGPIAEGTTIKASKDGVEIIAPAGNPEIEIDGPEPHPEIVPAIDKLPEYWFVDNYDKSKEWYLAVTKRDPERYGKFSCIGMFFGEELPNCVSHYNAVFISYRGVQISREDFERLVYKPWKEEQSANDGTYFDKPAPEARKTCSEGCSPSDYWAGGKCARVGCFVADPPIDPDEALEAQRRLNELKKKAEQREKELEKEEKLEKIDVLVVIASVLAIAAAIIGGAVL